MKPQRTLRKTFNSLRFRKKISENLRNNLRLSAGNKKNHRETKNNREQKNH